MGRIKRHHSMTFNQMSGRIKKVMESVESPAQLRMATTYCHRLIKQHEDAYDYDGWAQPWARLLFNYIKSKEKQYE